MKKSDINQAPNYFDTYVNKIEDIELLDALKQSITELDSLDFEALEKLGDYAYAEGKWTIKDIFQHIIDTERIMGYRALRFARNDDTQLPGFDENSFAKNVSTKKRSLRSLILELKLVHKSSMALFKSFDKKALKRKGIMFKSEVAVLAIGFIIAGHQRHHLKVIKERYMNQNK
jgi:mannitol/fructose-specific phosphotransferase system IIA component (Ntr-type)